MRLLLVDDHRILRESLAVQVARHPKVTSVQQAGNADEAVTLAGQNPPAIVVMDIEMPGMNPFHGAQQIQELAPTCKVIFLTGHDYDANIEQAIAAHAAGYVVKRDGIDVLMEAITKVSEGSLYFSQSVLERLVVDDHRLRLVRPKSDAVALLSRRERELLTLLGRGATLKQAALEMHVSYKTADNQKTSLMRKLNIHDRVELARFAIREGLVSPS